jgi:hypothetical protein
VRVVVPRDAGDHGYLALEVDGGGVGCVGFGVGLGRDGRGLGRDGRGLGLVGSWFGGGAGDDVELLGGLG